MDYRKIYDALIQRCKSRKKPPGYVELHHIRPRSMRGGDDAENLVYLTAREHFIAHWLLWRIHLTPSTARAWWRMACVAMDSPRYTSRNFERARVAFSKAHSGEGHHASRQVVCLDTGEVFASAGIAAAKIGVRRSGISENIKWGYRVKGLRFAFVGEAEPVFKTHRGMPLKPVRCLDTGEVFASCRHAGESCGVGDHAIRFAIRKKTKSAGKYWAWK